ncbi:protein draper-like isoform X4 [Mercenaria mercenaria]|uniref:protein draper-like isoform X4 n=1 Tax=Mercenaria mercenaria TaxID=6596 RepID=UPI00234EF2BF|nr:protein draper-like isoform X4 [Mercenaria mercenaria]
MTMLRTATVLIYFLCLFGVFCQVCKDCKCCKGDNACNGENICKNGCIEGYWGDQCLQSCPENCKTCVSDTNCTECMSGYHSEQCNYECGKGCVNNTCLQSGHCTCKSTSFKDGFCLLCASNDKFGDECNYTCPNNCAVCQSETNCKWCINSAFYGPYCQFKCSAGCNNGTCYKGGSCIKGCKANFTGKNCDSCVSGKHGPNCDTDCPENCQICFSDTYCTECKLGYYGNRCTNVCPPYCNEKTCDIHDICPYSCNGEFNITLNCDKCPSGKWGDYCQFKCPDKCSNCTSDDTCTKCMNGHYGPKCSKECPKFCLDSVCKYQGECYACKENHYDLYCESKCSSMCLNGTCSMLNGHCFECPWGFYGPFCNSTKCEDGFFGIGCKMKCQDRDGSCIACLTTQSGLYGGCTKCTTGKYPYISSGLNPAICAYCLQCKNSLCDPSNGYCIEGCDTDTKYGNNCLQNCSKHCKNQRCERTTGKCLYGCIDGYDGSQCTEGPGSGDDNLTVIVGAIVGAGVAVIIVVVFLAIFIGTRRRRKGTGANESSNAGGSIHEDVSPNALQVEDAIYAQPNKPRRTIVEEKNAVYDATHDNVDRKTFNKNIESDTVKAGIEISRDKDKQNQKNVEDANTLYDTTFDKNKKMLKSNNDYDVLSADSKRFPETENDKPNRMTLDETNAVYDTTNDNNKKMFDLNKDYDVLSAGKENDLGGDSDS